MKIKVSEDSKEKLEFESPRVGREELMLKSASEGVDEADDQPRRSVQPVAPPKKSRKKPLLIAILLALVVGGLGWYFGLRKKPTTTTSSVTVTGQKQTQKAQEEQSIIPENIVYAFRSNDTDPFIVYYRPAGEGARTAAMTLKTDEYVLRTDVRGNKVALSTSSGLYTSTDSGKTYSKVVSVSGDEQISGVRISTSQKRVIYATTSDFQTSLVKSIDFDGKNSEDVMTVDAGSVLIYGWNDIKNQIFYSKGCANCDGSPSSYLIYDTKAKSDKALTLLESAQKDNFTQQVNISDDFSTISVVSASPETGTEPALSNGVSPYFVTSYDTASGKITDVASIGSATEKLEDGSTKMHTVLSGFLADSTTQYYASGTDVYTVVNGKKTLFYQTDLDLLSVDFVGKNVVIVSTQKAVGDSILSSYNRTTKKATQILEGDNNTIIIGVTTK